MARKLAVIALAADMIFASPVPISKDVSTIIYSDIDSKQMDNYLQQQGIEDCQYKTENETEIQVPGSSRRFEYNFNDK